MTGFKFSCAEGEVDMLSPAVLNQVALPATRMREAVWEGTRGS